MPALVFKLIYRHSWLIEVFENLVKLFGGFQKVPGQVDLFKRSNSITLGSQFGPLLFCDIAISLVYWCPSTAEQWAVPRGADNICWSTKANSQVCWTDSFEAVIRNSWLSLFQKDHRYYGYGDHEAIMREHCNIQTISKYVSKPNVLIFEIVAISWPCFSFR